MTRKVVSLIVPVYKNPDWVKKAVKSALCQTYKELEILLVDDGSPDGCDFLCDELAKSDSRIKVFHKENGGVSSARNLGLDSAKGEYISFFDSDDFLEPCHIESLVSVLEESGSDIASCGLIYYRSENSFDPFENCDLLEVMTPKEAVFSMHREEVRFNGYLMNKLFRREVVENVRFDPNIAIHEDMLFIWDALMNCKKVCYRAKFTYHYLYHTTSAMNSAYSPKIESAVAASERMLEKMEKHFPEGVALSQKTLLFAHLYVANRRYAAGCLDRKTYQRIRSEMKKHHSPEAFSFVKGIDNRISYRMLLYGRGAYFLWKKAVSLLRKIDELSN